MNKTININLANIFFHIDEEAYDKLRRYLESIKRSFAGTKGSDEIIADIEARIAELFHEKMENERQVITQKEVDEVIGIMGQPEDYMVDEDIFEDEPTKSTDTPKKTRKLYRDIDSKYIGGVSSGIGYYLHLDAIWIRLLWILLTIFSWGGFIFIYILLWILIPEATTTAQKLDMRGEDVNISNIERKVREGFEEVADKVKNADYKKVGEKVKDGSKSFFDTLGEIIIFLFKVVGKFIGIILILTGAATLITLFIGMFAVGILGMVHIPGMDFYQLVNSTDTPVWLVSLMGFLAIGIPFFFLLYLGLKILVNNLKSIGNIAKFSLIGVWLLAIIGLTVLGIRQATSFAYTGSTTVREEIRIPRITDTLNIVMKSNELYEYQDNMYFGRMALTHNEHGERLLFSGDVRFDIKKSEDSLVYMKIRKEADGSSFDDAKVRSSKIDYGYSIQGDKVLLDNYFTTETKNKIRDQEVRITLYLPLQMVVRFDKSTKNRMGWNTHLDPDLDREKIQNHFWKVIDDGELKCLDCLEDSMENDTEDNDGKGKIIINKKGIDIDLGDKDSGLKVKIDSNGIKVKTTP